MSTTPIDYTALAKQAGAVDSQPAPSQSAPVDYTALAKQAGAVDSQPAPAARTPGEEIKQKYAEPVPPPVPVDPPRDHREELVRSIVGDRGLVSYRAARDTVGKVETLLKSPAEAYAAAKQAVQGIGQNIENAVVPGTGKLDQPALGQPIFPMPGVSALGEAETVAGKAAPTVVPTITSKIVNPFRKLASKFTGSDIQPALKTGINDVWNDVADKAGVPKPTTPSVQDMGNEVGDSIYARSRANYKMIDDATDGRFSGLEQSLKTVNQDLRFVTNDAEELALTTRKARLEMQMDQAMDEAQTKGVSQAHIDAAKRDFKQAQAIYDTNNQIRLSTTGVRPGMPGAKDVPEAVTAKPLMNRLNKLYNKGRLQQAVGEDNSAELIRHSAAAQKAASNVARNVRTAGIVGGGAVATGALAHEFLPK